MEVIAVLSVIIFIVLEIILTLGDDDEYVYLPSYKYVKYVILVARIIIWGISINRFFLIL